MSKAKRMLRETLRVEVSSAYPETLLNSCALSAVEFWDVECVDGCTVRMSIYERRLPELKREAEKCMCDVAVLSSGGGKSAARLLLRRRWLLLFALLTAALIALSSLFIWDIRISGSDKLSRGRILRALENCGVSTGSYWPALSSDLVRSQMIELLPELAWMSVNVNGSRAYVLIVEREEPPEIFDPQRAADVVAAKSGIVAKLSVLSGRPLVGPGQAVVQGETLVSGEMPSLTGETRHVRAGAEVSADTWYTLSSVRPAAEEKKTGVRRRKNRFALRIGARRINFFISGGNKLDGCDKIIHNYTVGASGLFSLPVWLVREEYVFYTAEDAPWTDTEGMYASLSAALSGEIDGVVLQRSFSSQQRGDAQYAQMRAHCIENIALTAEKEP